MHELVYDNFMLRFSWLARSINATLAKNAHSTCLHVWYGIKVSCLHAWQPIDHACIGFINLLLVATVARR
jgi:hypothetical protein